MVHSSLTALPQDTSLKNDAAQGVRYALRNSPYLSLRAINCVQHGKGILLSGRVPTFYLKQLAQSIAAHAAQGINEINAEIEVVQPGSGSLLRDLSPANFEFSLS